MITSYWHKNVILISHVMFYEGGGCVLIAYGLIKWTSKDNSVAGKKSRAEKEGVAVGMTAMAKSR